MKSTTYGLCKLTVKRVRCSLYEVMVVMVSCRPRVLYDEGKFEAMIFYRIRDIEIAAGNGQSWMNRRL